MKPPILIDFPESFETERLLIRSPLPGDGQELHAAVGESRAAWIQYFAKQHEVDLDRSFAYADSHSDLPMLQTVGHPVAVSPDIPLMRAAGRRQWSVVQWKVKPLTPRWALPSMTSSPGPVPMTSLPGPAPANRSGDNH